MNEDNIKQQYIEYYKTILIELCIESLEIESKNINKLVNKYAKKCYEVQNADFNDNFNQEHGKENK